MRVQLHDEKKDTSLVSMQVKKMLTNMLLTITEEPYSKSSRQSLLISNLFLKITINEHLLAKLFCFMYMLANSHCPFNTYKLCIFPLVCYNNIRSIHNAC